MLENKKAVIFDLDGTLMDSMWLWADIDIEYLGRYGHELPRDLQTEIEGMGFTETALYFKERFHLPDSIEEIKREWNRMAYDKYARAVRPKPGAASFLRHIRSRGIKTGIASSNSRELIAACLASNGMKDCFDCVTISCDVARGKPAPDVYLSAASSLGVEPESCLVFEDVPMGIRAGRSAGMQVCAVEDRHSMDQRQEIRRLADYYIRSYDEILNHTYEVLPDFH
ncbi:MAG: HAD family phosphatase [Lachnospiraceae bacterium]|nr:HAD family phosphatase [Lachnospiraceae bacterium]